MKGRVDYMCGRYYLADKTVQQIQGLTDNKEWNIEADTDIFPSQSAPVIVPKKEGGKGLSFQKQLWGFTGFSSKAKSKVIFNARAETALEKKLFRESVINRRCIVPATWFYEWDKSKNKVTFQREDHDTLFFAGFFQRYSEGERFVLLTTTANSSIQSVHDRMPLILERRDLNDWLFEQSRLEEFLKRIPCLLTAQKEYKQEELPFL